jgi:hypothetical protein
MPPEFNVYGVVVIALLIVILHDLDRLPDLLDAWKKANAPGVTILQNADYL